MFATPLIKLSVMVITKGNPREPYLITCSDRQGTQIGFRIGLNFIASAILVRANALLRAREFYSFFFQRTFFFFLFFSLLFSDFFSLFFSFFFLMF